jgi:hypothetical protein
MPRYSRKHQAAPRLFKGVVLVGASLDDVLMLGSGSEGTWTAKGDGKLKITSKSVDDLDVEMLSLVARRRVMFFRGQVLSRTSFVPAICFLYERLEMG